MASNPSGSLRPESYQILLMAGLDRNTSEIESIALLLSNLNTAEEGWERLLQLDRQIPGLGQHNVNELAPHGGLTGVYRIEHRAIFRGIQYVGMHLGTVNPEWFTRAVVTDSCYHVESALKFLAQVPDQHSLSVGMLLHKYRNRLPITPTLQSSLDYLNKSIYNRAKHTIETMDLDGHMFSPTDAIAVYLSCRMIGAQLLAKSGITTKHGMPIFQS